MRLALVDRMCEVESRAASQLLSSAGMGSAILGLAAMEAPGSEGWFAHILSFHFFLAC